MKSPERINHTREYNKENKTKTRIIEVPNAIRTEKCKVLLYT